MDDPAAVDASKEALSRERLLVAIRNLLPIIERSEEDVRIVGTASSLLRGIDLAAVDVDILARTRATVDDLSAEATRLGARCLHSPAWEQNPVFGQYFARFELADVCIEFSTVETNPGDNQIGECINSAPWERFDVLEVEGHRLPVVASELRLLSEVARWRPEWWKPIGAHLARSGYDHDLFEAALASLPSAPQPAMREAVRVDED